MLIRAGIKQPIRGWSHCAAASQTNGPAQIQLPSLFQSLRTGLPTSGVKHHEPKLGQTVKQPDFFLSVHTFNQSKKQGKYSSTLHSVNALAFLQVGLMFK